MHTTAADSRTKIFITLDTKCRPNPLFDKQTVLGLYYPSCATATEGLFVGVNGLAREGLIGSPGVPVFGYEIIV
jgi:hypothetical protein